MERILSKLFFIYAPKKNFISDQLKNDKRNFKKIGIGRYMFVFITEMRNI